MIKTKSDKKNVINRKGIKTQKLFIMKILGRILTVLQKSLTPFF
jgi:hypothetical protein